MVILLVVVPMVTVHGGHITKWEVFHLQGMPEPGGDRFRTIQLGHAKQEPPYNKRSIAWQSGTPGHVAYIAAYSGGANVNITDMCCGPDGQPPLNCWACVRTTPKPVSNYGGFIYRVNEPQ